MSDIFQKWSPKQMYALRRGLLWLKETQHTPGMIRLADSDPLKGAGRRPRRGKEMIQPQAHNKQEE